MVIEIYLQRKYRCWGADGTFRKAAIEWLITTDRVRYWYWCFHPSYNLFNCSRYRPSNILDLKKWSLVLRVPPTAWRSLPWSRYIRPGIIPINVDPQTPPFLSDITSDRITFQNRLLEPASPIATAVNSSPVRDMIRSSGRSVGLVLVKRGHWSSRRQHCQVGRRGRKREW